MAGSPRKKQKRRRSLIREKSLYMSGPVAFVGELSLSKEDLVFVPTRKFERMLGAKVIRILVAEVREVAVVDLGKKLEVRTDSGVETFLGEGACKVGGRLWALVLEREGKGKAVGEGGYEPDERIFFSDIVEIHLNRVKSVRAELSDRRLRFLSRRRSKKAAAGEALIALALLDIESVEFSVSKRELVLHLREDKTVVFGGPDRAGVREGEVVQSNPTIRLTGSGIPKLYGQLKVLGVGARREELEEEGDILIDQEKVGLYRGLVAHFGYLAASRLSLNFVPTGRLDGIFGAEALEIPFTHVVDLEVRTDTETRLVVCTKEAEHNFEVRAPMTWFSRLSRVILAGASEPHEEMLRDGQFTDEFIGERLEKWSKFVSSKMSYGVMLGGPAFSWMSDRALCRGTLMLTQTGVLFLPDDGNETSMLYARVEDVKRSADEQEKGEEIAFSARGIGYRMVPMGGVAFSFMFWARFDQRQRAGDLLEPGVGIRRMMGKTEGVRIKSPQAGDLLTESALIVAISGNIGVVVASGISSSYAKGSPVAIEVSKGDGIYRFSTIVAREFVGVDVEASTEKNSEEEAREGEKASVLVLRRPGGIYFQNRRVEFRVFYEEVRIKVICADALGESEEWEGEEEYDEVGEIRRFRDCRLLNLSAHGCLLESANEFLPGTRVVIELPVTLGTIDLAAECVRAVPPFGERVHWAFGFAFAEMRTGYRDRIYRIMYRQQAAEKRSKDRELEDSAAASEGDDSDTQA